jgi:tetratricopeptide (TPR) repeat protein
MPTFSCHLRTLSCHVRAALSSAPRRLAIGRAVVGFATGYAPLGLAAGCATLGLAAGCAAPPPAATPASSRADGAVQEADRLTRQGHADRAEAVLRPAIDEAKRSGDRRAEARLLVELGRSRVDAMWHHGGGIAAALEPLERALTLAQTGSDRPLVGAALDALGMAYYSRRMLGNEGTWEQADAYFVRATPLLAGTDEEDRVRFHLGLVRQQRGEDEPARVEFERSLAAADKTGDRMYRSFAERHLGYLAEKQGDLGRALELQRASLADREAVGLVPGAAMAHLAVGDLLLKLNRLDEARAHYAKASELGRSTDSALVRANAAIALARLGLREGRIDEAKRHAAEATAAAEAGRDDGSLIEALAAFAEARAKGGDRSGAEADLARAYGLAKRGSDPDTLALLDRVAREHGLKHASNAALN